jgi:hypothetical protein
MRLKGINDYAQNYAGNAYQQAFNNYNGQPVEHLQPPVEYRWPWKCREPAKRRACGFHVAGDTASTIQGAGQAQAAGTVGSGECAYGRGE